MPIIIKSIIDILLITLISLGYMIIVSNLRYIEKIFI